MWIGIVSDTHGHVKNTRRAVEAMKAYDVELVIHCGDIGSTAIVPLFAAWPTHFVFGNVDGNEGALRRAIESAGQTCHGRFGSLEIGNRKIAFLHSDDSRMFEKTVHSGEWDLVCYGHTHVAEQHAESTTLVLNPGALYRAAQHTVAIAELPSLRIISINLQR